jgi:hypothetical protein
VRQKSSNVVSGGGLSGWLEMGGGSNSAQEDEDGGRQHRVRHGEPDRSGRLDESDPGIRVGSSQDECGPGTRGLVVSPSRRVDG